MKSILDDYGLSDRLVSEYNDALIDDMNLAELDACRNRITDASKEWLNAQLVK